jgi:uncharacterized membrane protein
MNLAPLLDAPLAVRVHVFTVLPAFVLGTWLIFASRKGAPVHRVVGAVYLCLMTVTAITTLLMHQINPKGFLGLSPIHLFVPLTLVAVASALWGAHRHNVRAHRIAMLSLYIGGFLIAGGLTFLPGRIMHAVVLGP